MDHCCSGGLFHLAVLLNLKALAKLEIYSRFIKDLGFIAIANAIVISFNSFLAMFIKNEVITIRPIVIIAIISIMMIYNSGLS